MTPTAPPFDWTNQCDMNEQKRAITPPTPDTVPLSAEALQGIRDRLAASVGYDEAAWCFDVDRGASSPLKTRIYEKTTDEIWADCDGEAHAVKIRDSLNQNRLLRYLAHVALQDLLATLDAERQAHEETQQENLRLHTVLASFQRAIRRIVEADARGEEWEAGLAQLREVASTPLDKHELAAQELIEAARELRELKVAHRERLELICGHLESMEETYQGYRPDAYGLPDKASAKRLTNAEALALVAGSAWVDDKPASWSEPDLARHARGFVHGEMVAGANFSSVVRVLQWAKELRASLEPSTGEGETP